MKRFLKALLGLVRRTTGAFLPSVTQRGGSKRRSKRAPSFLAHWKALKKAYNRLTVWNQLGVWGSVASIVGVLLAFIAFVPREDRTKPNVAAVTTSTVMASPHVSQVGDAVQTQVIPDWGEIVDPVGDCDFTTDGYGKELNFRIPPADRSLSPERAMTNAPRVLQTFQGDFTWTIEVSASFTNEATSLTLERHPYQSAGILVWLDESNFIKFQRANLIVGGRAFESVSLTERRNGKHVTLQEADLQLSAPPVMLKVQRRGNALDASFSADGAKWVTMDRLVRPLPASLSVGVFAGNNTSAGLYAKFSTPKRTAY